LFLKALAIAILIFAALSSGYILFWHYVIENDVFPEHFGSTNPTEELEVTMTDKIEVVVWKNIRVGEELYPFLPKYWTRFEQPYLWNYHIAAFVGFSLISVIVWYVAYVKGIQSAYEKQAKSIYGNNTKVIWQ
jgi:glucan phosphoethanolaminetransferase (alkaline phosphatase superfamily)